jgi:hypothetical protein
VLDELEPAALYPGALGPAPAADGVLCALTGATAEGEEDATIDGEELG